MKKFLLIATTILFLSTASVAAPVIKAQVNGNWSSTATWHLNRLPQVGDTIEIPAGLTVTVGFDQTINGFVYMKIFGTLRFQNNNSTLNLGSSSIIIVYDGATISGGGSASQKIRIGNNAVYEGNNADVTGPAMANGTSSGFVNYSSTPLPVRFGSFSLALKGKDVLVQWSTLEEYNTKSFEIERSNDGTNWAVIASVVAAGHSNRTTNYSYTDINAAAGTAWYRVKQVDLDGRFSVTPVRTIKAASPNVPVEIFGFGNGKVVLQFAQQVKGAVTVTFVTAGGQVLSKQVVQQPVGQVVLNSTTTAKGAVIVSVITADAAVARQVIF